MPKPCKWRRATPSVPSVGAANTSPKIRKIMVLVVFNDFSTKNVADSWSFGSVWTLRSSFEARPTSNGPSSELKRSYEDFRSIILRN